MSTRTAKLAETLRQAPAATNGQEVAKKRDVARDLLDSMEAEFAKCLPAALPPDLFMRVALTGFRRTPELLECTRRSLLGALLEAARLGLEPCTEQAHLVPYKGTCQLIVGYQGYVQLMYRSPQVVSVEAELIYEADAWRDIRGDNPEFWHEPAWVPERARDGWTGEGRGEPVLAYAYAELTGGRRTRVVMVPKAQALQLQREALAGKQNPGRSPWSTNFTAMWLKSPVRRLRNWAPMSTELRRAAHVDGTTFDEQGQPDRDVDTIDAEVVPTEQDTSGADWSDVKVAEIPTP